MLVFIVSMHLCLALSSFPRVILYIHRAIYRRADVYLLDDPLSAVDTVVGRRLFEACLKGVLSSSVVVLVTHQLQYAQLADTMLVLDQVGLSDTTYVYTVYLGFRPCISNKHFLQYYQDIVANLYKSEWWEQVNHVKESGGRLNIL